MLEWQVGETPPHPEERAPQRGGLWLALLVMGAAVVLLAQQWRVNDAALRADLEALVSTENQTLRFGTAPDAGDLADPNAPAAWQECYAAQFGKMGPATPEPELVEVEQRGRWARVKLRYPDDRYPDVTRIYRLYDDQAWRRSPLASSPWTEFALVPGPFELSSEGPTFVLVPELPEWRQHLLAQWPGITCRDCELELVVFPTPAAPELLHIDQPTLCLNDPAFAQGERLSPLPQERQAALAQLRGVMATLTQPDGVDYPALSDQDTSPFTRDPKHEWLLLLMMLQEAETYDWGLDDAEARALRDSWRAELDYRWIDPFDAEVPFYPEFARAEERARYLMLRLLVAQRITVPRDTEGAVMLAQILHTFDPERFDLERYFGALIGGSTANLKELYSDYITTPEEAQQ